MVSAIDARKEADGTWHVYVAGGRKDTGIDLIEWAKAVVSLGAGEILLTSMDKDGTKSGFDLDMLNAVADVVNVPIIASGGAGNIDHMVDVLKKQLQQVRLPLPFSTLAKFQLLIPKLPWLLQELR